MPEVCVSRWRIVSRAGLPSAVLSSLNSGRYFSTGSSTESLPSSWSIRTAVAVMGLVIEAIQKIVSGRIGLFSAMSALPIASRWTIPSGVATSVAPAISWLSMNGAAIGDGRGRRRILTFWWLLPSENRGVHSEE